MKKNNNKRGIIALPIVVLLTVIIVSIAIGLSSVSYNENVSSLGASKSAKALSYALSGVEDALKRIARDRTYSETTWDTDPPADGSYKIDIASPTASCATVLDGCARVRVHYSSGKSPTIITSEGVSGTYSRKIQVNVMVDSNGVITSTTAIEIKTLPTISTAQATLSANSAILNGWINPNGNTANAWFRYHTTQPSSCTDDTAVWSGSTRAPSSGSVSISGNGQNFSALISSASISVTAGTTYYYCAIADNGGSPATKVYGNIFRFVAI